MSDETAPQDGNVFHINVHSNDTADYIARMAYAMAVHNGHAVQAKKPTLTDAEREAIEAAARIVDEYDDEMDGFPSGAAATLRRLLERLG
jgi:tagatose-1,6-bisphosphate aldolase non-catalytic subunit AgaZ/GatZ